MHDHQINEHVPICINYQTSTFEIKQVMIKTGGDVEMKGAGSIHGNMLLSNGIISARMGEIIKKNSVMWNSIHLKGQKLWQLWLKQVDSPGPPPRRHQCLLLHRKKKNLAPWGLTQNNIDRMGKSVEMWVSLKMFTKLHSTHGWGMCFPYFLYGSHVNPCSLSDILQVTCDFVTVPTEACWMQSVGEWEKTSGPPLEQLSRREGSPN